MYLFTNVRAGHVGRMVRVGLFTVAGLGSCFSYLHLKPKVKQRGTEPVQFKLQ